MKTKPRICRIEGCDLPREPGAFLCRVHLNGKRRCEGRVRVYDEQTGEVLSERQCKKVARPGNVVCAAHGANSPKAMVSTAKAEAHTAMQRFVTPYEGDLDYVTAFEKEFRRTYSRILWLEAAIGALENEQDLIWGKTKSEDIEAAEFSGTNTTYEARVHIYEDMLRWERKHFLELEKVWIKANLDEKKLTILRRYIDFTYAKVNDAARALGHDPTDPHVRDTLMALFKEVE